MMALSDLKLGFQVSNSRLSGKQIARFSFVLLPPRLICYTRSPGPKVLGKSQEHCRLWVLVAVTGLVSLRDARPRIVHVVEYLEAR
jgi:hypothetical protein